MERTAVVEKRLASSILYLEDKDNTPCMRMQSLIDAKWKERCDEGNAHFGCTFSKENRPARENSVAPVGPNR